MIKRNYNNGFTLIEVLVSIFIMAIIVMTILPVYTSIMGTKSGMEASGVRQMREAQALMNLLRVDLKSAFISKKAGENKFIIVNNRDFEGKALDDLHFTSFSYPTVGTSIAASDQCEVGYFIDDDGEKRTLVRRVSTILDSDISEGGDKIKLTDSIDYFDVVAYAGSFDALGASGEPIEEPMVKKMPGAIMIKIGLKADDGSVSDYMTAMDLPHYVEEVKKEEKKPADEDKKNDDNKDGDNKDGDNKDGDGKGEPG